MHLFPHLPQLETFVLKSLQVVPHLNKSFEQTQEPDEQISFDVHTTPQSPQFLASVLIDESIPVEHSLNPSGAMHVPS